MSRGTPSTADRQLLAYAEAHGVPVSASQLERWRAQGLIPGNVHRALGRGRGSTSVPADGADELVVFLGGQARVGRRPHDLALLAYDAGLAVPEPAVRAAFRASVDQIMLPAEKELAAPEDEAARADWAWEVAQRQVDTHANSVLIPRRMRRIDERLGRLMPWSHESIAKFDKGTAPAEPMRARDLDALSTVALLAGGSELTTTTMGQMMRAMGPPGAAHPAASMMEYEHNPDLTQIGDAAGFTLMPAGDIRKDLLLVLKEATTQEMRLAWHTAAAQREWALGLTEQVEAELDTGLPGPACLEWYIGSVFGIHRMIVRTELRTRRDTLMWQASTTVSLLHTARGLRLLRKAIPDGQFDLLPVLVPQFMHELAGVSAPPGFSLASHILERGAEA